jgi:uncharacterized protein YukE
MASWEDMVNAVCVAGRPKMIGALHDQWGTTFTNAQTVADAVRDVIKDLKPYWQGQAADDYYGKLEKIAKTVEQTRDNNSDAQPLLQAAQVSLQNAQTNMPVPDYMLDNVQDRQKKLDAANQAYGTGALVAQGLDPAVGVSYLSFALLPGDFQQGFMNTIGNATREVFGHVTAWLNDKTDEAKGYYDSVDNTYAQTSVTTADPKQALTGISQGEYTGYPGSQNFGGGTNSGVPGVGGDGYKPSSFDPSKAGSGVGGYNPAGTGTSGYDPNSSGYDPNAGSLSSLAGAGPGDLSGLGAGGSGLGGLGGGAGGLAGGLGSGGLGAAGAGRPVGGPSLPMGLGGMGGAAGRGAAGQGRGMMGGAGHGAGGHGSGDEHETWLTEDEDPWGGDSDAPPSLLG